MYQEGDNFFFFCNLKVNLIDDLQSWRKFIKIIKSFETFSSQMSFGWPGFAKAISSFWVLLGNEHFHASFAKTIDSWG
jgi:hypothetical protein